MKITLTLVCLAAWLGVFHAARADTPTAKPSHVSGSQAASVTGSDLSLPPKKDLAMQIVSSAENSSLDWRAQYAYIEDIGDERGYTGGIIGFCSGTGDMLDVVRRYTQISPTNILAKYLSALAKVDGTDSHQGLDPGFVKDWRTAATDPLFQKSQDWERDTIYFDPAVRIAKADGLRALGQLIYYDAIVMHGPGNGGFGSIRKTAMRQAKTPAQGGNEVVYLNAFLDARASSMRTEKAHSNTSRIDTAQRVFLQAGNLDLTLPLSWQVYGTKFHVEAPSPTVDSASGGDAEKRP